MWLKPLIIGNRPRNLHSRGQLHPWNAQIESSPQRKRLVYPCKSNTLLYCTKHPFIFSATYIEVLICKESSVVLYPKVSRYIDGHTINIASLASVYLLSHYDPPISNVVQICGDTCYVMMKPSHATRHCCLVTHFGCHGLPSLNLLLY